jgi:hypothetical protein
MKLPLPADGPLLDSRTLRAVAKVFDDADRCAMAHARHHTYCKDGKDCPAQVAWTARAMTFREAAAELRTAAIKIDQMTGVPQ